MKMFRLLLSVLTISIAFVGICQDVNGGIIIGGPVQWKVADGGNDHYYSLYQSNGISWTDARDSAAALDFLW